MALPATGPIFLASVKGTGVNSRNNTGLWGLDSRGFIRQLLRNGDVLGDYTVKKFTLLTSVPGAFSATRSFNNAGGVTAFVSFANRPQALIFIGIP